MINAQNANADLDQSSAFRSSVIDLTASAIAKAATQSAAADKETPLRLIPKEEAKEVLGRSPDIGDMLLMRAWFVIQPAAYKADPQANEVRIRLFNRNAAGQEFEAA